MNKKLLFSMFMLLLAGCAIHGTEFECKGGRGQRCTSVSKVNKMIDRGEINDELEEINSIEAKEMILTKAKVQKHPVERKKFDIWMPNETEEKNKS